MRILLATIFVFHSAGCLFAQQLSPLTVKDIGLMLRLGCSNEMILRDVSARHFAGTLDLAGEKELSQAKASPALLDALKSGNNAASEEELAQGRKRIADAKVSAQQAAARDRAAAQAAAAREYAAREDAARKYAYNAEHAANVCERAKWLAKLVTVNPAFREQYDEAGHQCLALIAAINAETARRERFLHDIKAAAAAGAAQGAQSAAQLNDGTRSIDWGVAPPNKGTGSIDY